MWCAQGTLVSERLRFKGFQIEIIAVHCLCSVLDFEFNLGYVTAWTGNTSDHLTKKGWTGHTELSAISNAISSPPATKSSFWWQWCPQSPSIHTSHYHILLHTLQALSQFYLPESVLLEADWRDTSELLEVGYVCLPMVGAGAFFKKDATRCPALGHMWWNTNSDVFVFLPSQKIFSLPLGNTGPLCSAIAAAAATVPITTTTTSSAETQTGGLETAVQCTSWIPGRWAGPGVQQPLKWNEVQCLTFVISHCYFIAIYYHIDYYYILLYFLFLQCYYLIITHYSNIFILYF